MVSILVQPNDTAWKPGGNFSQFGQQFDEATSDDNAVTPSNNKLVSSTLSQHTAVSMPRSQVHYFLFMGRHCGYILAEMIQKLAVISRNFVNTLMRLLLMKKQWHLQTIN